ncbi:MAG: 1-deoxy-D-xylulose-5-phosphate synthase [Clostridia bacterium]|nr:1-deoxy-D-xylulose-5-phosphate synthase [Clostridia bacterium]
MILEKLTASADIKHLADSQLKVLANEIRSFLIEHVAETGGHLAANLGVVELTIAIHHVFDVEYDRVIWDVGHQAYTHKILTGRRDAFSTLRQMGGISGFPKAEESNADAFNTGHSSTSISAAAGYAAAARLKGEERTAIAVIGDGSLNGGMAFEAMNHAGAMRVPMIVILNDNGMSISKNVGGLSRRLKKIRNTRRYYEFKSGVKGTLDKIPVIGKPLKNRIAGIKRMLKPLVVKTVLFEDLGLHYLGPVDGHNIESLKVVLNEAKKLNEPVLVHVCTKKGKGYLPAERNPEYFHGISSFNSQTGRPLKINETMDWSTVFGKYLIELAEKNPKLVAITAAMPSGTGLVEFEKRFPTRFFNVGIAEQHAVTFAAGLAKAGMVPCFAVYSTFLQRGYDQLLHDVALQNLHAVFCLDRSGPVGADGETHQGVFDISYLSHLPNFTILSPSNITDFKEMLTFAVEECTGPVAIRYPRGTIKNAIWQNDNREVCKSAVCREGKDVLLLAVGTTVYDAMETAELLEKKGISASVLDARIIRPLDKELILKHSDGKKVVATIEDNVITGGFGQQILALLKRDTMIFAYPDEPIVQGTVGQLKEKYGISSKQIFEKIYREF